MDTGDKIASLVAFNSALLLAHWKADTVTNAHRALGDLYEDMTELTDKLAEIYMGKNGVIQCGVQQGKDLTNPPDEGMEIVNSLRSEFTTGKDDDLLNVLADMDSVLNKTKYLLKSKTAVSSNIKRFDTKGLPE